MPTCWQRSAHRLDIVRRGRFWLLPGRSDVHTALGRAAARHHQRIFVSRAHLNRDDVLARLAKQPVRNFARVNFHLGDWMAPIVASARTRLEGETIRIGQSWSEDAFLVPGQRLMSDSGEYANVRNWRDPLGRPTDVRGARLSRSFALRPKRAYSGCARGAAGSARPCRPLWRCGASRLELDRLSGVKAMSGHALSTAQTVGDCITDQGANATPASTMRCVCCSHVGSRP